MRGVMSIGGREPDRERDAVPIHYEVVLRTELAAVRRVGADLLAPRFARTLRLSRLARR
jgi:hypothetical protein